MELQMIQVIATDIEMEVKDPYIFILPYSHYCELKDKFTFNWSAVETIADNLCDKKVYLSWAEFYKFVDYFKRDLDDYLHFRKAP